MIDKTILPKKYLGQNFIANPRVAEKIISLCNFPAGTTVLEIGPGQGALTRLIAPQVKKIIAVEKDAALAHRLHDEFQNQANVTVIHQDILDFPFSSLPPGTIILGNLPYNIATPIIEKAIHFRDRFPTFYLTIQLEHANRIAAKPKSKEYGSLSCFVQFYADVKKLFVIKNTSFYPVPKVQSAFLRMDFLPNPRFKTDEQLLFKTIRTAFQQRRKMLINALNCIYDKGALTQALAALHITEKSRPEELTLEQFVKIVEWLKRATV